MLKLVKRIDNANKYVARNGKEYPRVNYYLVLENGKWISIRPSFMGDTKCLDAVAELVVNSKKEQSEL